jgi:hypothetical protein
LVTIEVFSSRATASWRWYGFPGIIAGKSVLRQRTSTLEAVARKDLNSYENCSLFLAMSAFSAAAERYFQVWRYYEISSRFFVFALYGSVPQRSLRGFLRRFL